MCLAFDADCRTNPTVARSLLSAAEGLLNEGYLLELETWDIADAKGIDDLLAAQKTPQVLRGEAVLAEIRAAAAKLGIDTTTPNSVAQRLQQVLLEQGAEGIFRDSLLLTAMAKLSNDNPAEFAAVRASLKGKVNLRDLDRTLQSIKIRLRSERPAQPPCAPEYLVQGGKICPSEDDGGRTRRVRAVQLHRPDR